MSKAGELPPRFIAQEKFSLILKLSNKTVLIEYCKIDMVPLWKKFEYNSLKSVESVGAL
jgi:hypothetical protein